MISAILTGLLVGLIRSASLGPSFLVLVHTAVQKSKKLAFFFSAGGIASDIVIAFVLLAGHQTLMSSPSRITIFSGILWLFLLVIGVAMLAQRFSLSSSLATNLHENASIFYTFTKGFLLSAANPGVRIFWLTIIAIFTLKFPHSAVAALILTVIAITFFTDILKLHFAPRLKSLIRPKILKNTLRRVGVLILIFSIFLLRNARICGTDTAHCERIIEKNSQRDFLQKF